MNKEKHVMKSEQIKKEELWEYAKSIGLEMLGVAPVERFDPLDPSGKPRSILPEARSVIVIGVSIPRGQYLGTENGILWMNADQRIGSRFLLSLCRYIEKDGFEAVPLLSHKAKYYPKTRPVRSDREIPNVVPSYAYAAVAAGLGEIGFCGLFLTPAFGPRQSLGMIITDAVIEPDPVFEGRICDHEKCKACAHICPSGAISADKTVTVDICGKKMTLADINYNLCRMCQNGAAPDFTYQTGSEELMPDMIGNQPRISEVSSVLTKKSIPNIQMALCNRTCISHLEDEKKLNRVHRNPFRTEEPWKLEIWEKRGN
jgi:epoxyqueuosine reductase QueG